VKTEWKEYNGSDEQIAEMQEAQYGVLLSNNPSEIVDVSDMILLESYLNEQDVHEYLICNPHPLADMIRKQALTGQPVWIMYMKDLMVLRPGDKAWRKEIIVTTTPDWNIPNAEYSFTPFKEEV